MSESGRKPPKRAEVFTRLRRRQTGYHRPTPSAWFSLVLLYSLPRANPFRTFTHIPITPCAFALVVGMSDMHEATFVWYAINVYLGAG